MQIDSNYLFIGDPHLGKRFTTGVPLERRGERENKQWEKFEELLNDKDHNVKIIVGDLFDSFEVPNEVTLTAAELLLEASASNPTHEFYVEKGNHDGSRDIEKRSSFDVLRAILSYHPKAKVVSGSAYEDPEGRFAIVPWDAFLSARVMMGSLTKDRQFGFIVGHWDVIDFGDENPNMIPVELLKKHTSLVITGHDHNAGELEIDGLKIIKTGSMQPYSHGEDSNGDTYLTLTLEQYEKLDPTSLKDKCVRFRLAPGEEVPVGLDCLQITTIPISQKEKEEVEVQIAEFDLKALFNKAFEDRKVPDEIRDEIWGKYQEKHS